MSVTAAAGSGTIQLSGGRINGAAAAGSEIACQIAVDVTSSTAGVYHNTNASITGVNNLTNLVGDEVLAVGIPQLVAGKSVSGGLAAEQTGAPTDGYYVISVQNVGAGPTFGAINLVDNLPAGVSATAVSSADGAVSCGTLPATGTLTCTFTPSVPIPVGGSASVRINVAIPGTATGSVTNVVAVGGGGDPDPLPTCPNASNQQCAQTTTPLSQLADLSITKTDGRTTYTPGAALTYTIVASNAGPSNAVGATVTDTFPAAFTGTWTCIGAGGATCPASGSGNINATVSIPSGGSVTFTVTGTVSAAATGPLSNTATVAVPAGLVDPTPGNNQATDVDTAAPSANLSAVKSGTASVGYGGALSYSVVVTDTGPSNANGSTFSDTLPAGISNIVASCGTPVGGAVCGTVNVAGNAVTSTITTLPVNGSVTFTITGNAPTSGASVTNTASAQPPAGTTDPDPANNTGTATTTLLQPQLTVSKTATPSPFTVGQPASYTITVTNAGAGPTAGNVTVSDALPAGITLTGASGANWSCTGTTAVSCVYTGVLAAGASTTVTLQVAVAASAANGNNTATASGGGDAGCPAAARCSDTVTVPVNASADIVLAKTVDNPAPNVGETVTFTVTASNAGPSNATGVAVTDALPAGLSFVSATPSQGSYDSATGLWTIGALANGAQATLTMTAQVLSAGALSNTATKSAGDQFDPNTSNNAATASLNAQPSADLQVNKTASTATPNLGSNVTFTITVRNGGPNDATGVVVDDALPAGLNFVSATPSQGSYDPGTGVWTIGALSNGVEATLTMVATVGMPGELTNTAGIAASDQHDPNPANDSSGVTINGQAADIQVLKTVDEANPTRGDTATFTVTVTNLGPSAATGVRVEDALPAGLSFVSATPSQGSYDPGTGLWTIGNLAASGAGAVATLTVSATVDSDAGATNQASLDALDQTDPNSGNNQAEASVTPVASADVSVSKTGPADATPGTQVTYTLVVSNAGPSTAAQVSLADPTPAGLTFVSADAPCAGGFPCNLGDLAAGASVTVNVTYAIPANYAGADPIRNTATVSSPTGDPQTDNDSSTVTTPVVRRADVSMSKTAPATATAAGTISYTLVVSNAGPSDANGTTVSDPLPAGLSNATVGCGGETGGAVCGAFDTSVAGTIATLPAGASATITITATAPNDGSTLSNTATATPPAGTTDPDPANNQDTADTAVNASADVGVTKTGPATATPGTNVTYTLVVSNTGPSTATAVSLADPTPAGLLFVSADAPCAGGFPCNLGDLAAGASATVNVTYAIPPGQTGTIANTASVTSPTPDPDGGDNTSTVTTGLSASADVSVTKSGPATVPAAGTVTYTLVVSNAGPSDANGTTVSDPLPAGLSNAAVNCSASGGAVCGAFDTSVAGTITTLPAGGSATITITATAPDDAATLSNTATVAPPPGTADPDPSDNTSPPVQTQVTPVANLSLLKSGPATVTSGGAISYTLLIANAGPSRADGATYSDAVPSGITDVAASCGSATGGAICAAPNVAGNAVSGSIPTLPANGSVTITITGAAPVGAQTLTNTAGVTVPGGTTDPTPGDNTSTVTTEVGSAADIAVSKTVDNAAPNVGETVTFTVTAANQGPNDATGVQVTDGLPAGLTFVSATPSQGTYDSASGLWTVGALADGASATLQISATVTQPGAIVNTATRTGGDQLDPDTSNNAGSAGVNAGTLADLQVNKTADTLTPNLGSDVTFTITVRNAGPSPATGVNVSDVLPAGLAFVSATPSLGAYDETTGLWSVGDLAAGVERTLTIVATVTQAGEITNTATGAANEPDPNTANNQSGVTPNGQAADLQVVKTVDDANPRLGQDVTFTVTLTNLGPNAATNVRVDDVLPAGLGFVGATPSQGTYDPATGVWTVGDLAASGAGAVATLAVTTTVTQTGAITNVAASAGGDQTDPTPSNDEGSATVTVPASVDVSIVKSGPATVGAGGTISYTLVVANAGPDAANGASYSDDVPAGITGLAASCGSPVGGAVCAAPTVTGNTVAGTVPTLPANGSVTITITGTAPADATTLSNTATVTPPPGGDDPDPSDNTSPPVQTEVTPVARPVDRQDRSGRGRLGRHDHLHADGRQRRPEQRRRRHGQRSAAGRPERRERGMRWRERRCGLRRVRRHGGGHDRHPAGRRQRHDHDHRDGADAGGHAEQHGDGGAAGGSDRSAAGQRHQRHGGDGNRRADGRPEREQERPAHDRRRQHAGLHRGGEQRRPGHRGRRAGGRSDAAGTGLRRQRRRLQHGVSVRTRRPRQRRLGDHHQHLRGAARVRRLQSDRQHRQREQRHRRPEPGRQQRHRADRGRHRRPGGGHDGDRCADADGAGRHAGDGGDHVHQQRTAAGRRRHLHGGRAERAGRGRRNGRHAGDAVHAGDAGGEPGGRRDDHLHDAVHAGSGRYLDPAHDRGEPDPGHDPGQRRRAEPGDRGGAGRGGPEREQAGPGDGERRRQHRLHAERDQPRPGRGGRREPGRSDAGRAELRLGRRAVRGRLPVRDRHAGQRPDGDVHGDLRDRRRLQRHADQHGDGQFQHARPGSGQRQQQFGHDGGRQPAGGEGAGAGRRALDARPDGPAADAGGRPRPAAPARLTMSASRSPQRRPGRRRHIRRFPTGASPLRR